MREAAARTQCVNNLKQQGLALHSFNDAWHRFPAALIHSGRYNVAAASATPYCGPEVCYTGQTYVVYNHTGFVALLPYLDQGPLFAQYNYQMVSSSSSPYGLAIGTDPGATNPNRIIAGTSLAVYTCPSDTSPAPQITDSPFTTTDYYERYNTRRSNYLFNAGNTTDYNAPYNTISIASQGTFGNDGASALNQIKDGTSNTLAIGESRQLHTSTSYGPYWGAGTHTSVHGSLAAANGVVGGAVPNYPLGLCSGSTDMYCQYAWGFGSWHPGVTNFLYCDGHVTQIENGVSSTTFTALTTPQGGETVAPPE